MCFGLRLTFSGLFGDFGSLLVCDFVWAGPIQLLWVLVAGFGGYGILVFRVDVGVWVFVFGFGGFVILWVVSAGFWVI